jgi:hypothetical protein
MSVSDRISSPVIFILFYINISMLWIKIDFYKLIWLNGNIKNICDFSYAPNIGKCFFEKWFFWNNFTMETILRQNKQSINTIIHQFYWLKTLFLVQLYIIKYVPEKFHLPHWYVINWFCNVDIELSKVAMWVFYILVRFNFTLTKAGTRPMTTVGQLDKNFLFI